jgi:hypothetical protein
LYAKCQRHGSLRPAGTLKARNRIVTILSLRPLLLALGLCRLSQDSLAYG